MFRLCPEGQVSKGGWEDGVMEGMEAAVIWGIALSMPCTHITGMERF